MAVVLAEGFSASTAITDFGSYGLATGINNVAVNTNGPLGDNYITGGSTNNCYFNLRPLKTPISTIFFGARYLATTAFSGTYQVLCQLYSSLGNPQLSFCLVGTNVGAVSVYRGGPGGTLLGTITLTTALSPSVWRFLEFSATINATTGSVSVRQDGVVVGSLTNVNTAGDPSALNVFSCGLGYNQGSCFIQDAAHVYVTDNNAPNAGFLGDVRVFPRFPTANAAVQFTPNGLASNWQNAAKVPPVPATDYNSDATVGNQDTFSGGALPSGLGNIFAVSIKTLLQDAAAGPRGMENILVSGTTTATGTSTQPPVSPSADYVVDIWDTDPNTGAAWTEANAQATTFGYKIAS